MSEALNCGECGKPCRRVGPWLCECGSEWFDVEACAAADRMVASYKAAMDTVRAERAAAESRETRLREAAAYFLPLIEQSIDEERSRAGAYMTREAATALLRLRAALRDEETQG